MAKIYVTEPSTTGGVGAMGRSILAGALRRAGHDVVVVDISRRESDQDAQEDLFSPSSRTVADSGWLPRPDAWFISCLYPRQLVEIDRFFARLGVPLWRRDRGAADPLIAFGGQAAIAPAPILPFADVVALGDGEITGVALANALDTGGKQAAIELANSNDWAINENSPKRLIRISGSLDNPMVPLDVFPTPTIEIARGCESKCAFCTIGWAGGKYREAPRDRVLAALDIVRGKRVNLFAPDYSGVSWSEDLDQVAQRLGCHQSGRDARLDYAVKSINKGGIAKQFSFGVEGASERIRRAIGKPLSNDLIVETMERLGGISKIIWYVILGFPGESQADYDEFMKLIEHVIRVYRGKLDITLTHLQSAPHTPLERISNYWDARSGEFAANMRELGRKAWMDNGTKLLFGGYKGKELHEHDVFLQRMGHDGAQYLAQSRVSKISEGRWRSVAQSTGLDVGNLLGFQSHTLPWAWVDVGVPVQAKVKAARNYAKAMGICDSAVIHND